MRILLLEDDIAVASGIREALERAGYTVDWLDHAAQAESALQLTAYDLAIVDLGLPDMDGLQLIRRIRQQAQLLPVLILTARDTIDERVRGLDTGADDYMVKPFLIPELLARMRALIRRNRAAASNLLVIGPLQLDSGTHQVLLDSEAIELTGQEWNVLQQLALAAPNVVGKSQLAESLGAFDKEITPNAIEIYVSRLRMKLQHPSLIIRTVRGLGYRLESAEGETFCNG